MNLNNNKLHYKLYRDDNSHYKLYKFSKKWIVAGVVTAATTFAVSTIDAFNQLSVNADVNSLTSNNDNSSNDSVMSNSSVASSSTVIESAGDSISESSSNSNVSPNSTTATSIASSNSVINSNDTDHNSVNNIQKSDNTSLISNVDSNSGAKSSSSFPTTSSSAGNSLVNDSNKSTVYSSASGVNLQSNSDSSNSSNISSNNISSAFNSLAQKLNNTSLSSAQNVTVYGNVISLNDSIASNASDDLKKHIKEVDGNYYYYSDDNKVSGSMLINDGGNFYYFDSNGELSTNNPNFSSSQGTITTNSNNAIDSQSSNSITNIDGFLTPDTWYRPKEILKDGISWQPSTETDLRPLLTVWWPSKQVEVNYLNYMGQQGLLNNANFDSNSDQEALNSAASAAQANIESKIASSNGNTDWLKTTISNFTKTQDQWNINSEDHNNNDGFQGGTLAYQNNPQTPNNNSNYRLLNRTPSQQDGKVNYTLSPYTGYEFLLGNDVDNSNPVVQAENLNWLHYLMNFGSITQNDPNANFDSIRVDAVENMDADTLNIAAQYLNDAYQLNQSENNANDHISILEDWSKNDPQYIKDHGTDYLTIDGSFLDAIQSGLLNAPDQRGSLTPLINGLVDRENDDSDDSAYPNYSIVRAHDNGVQNIIAQIVKDQIDPTSTGYVLTNDQLAKAFQIYDNDQKQTVKQYTQYNIPSAYALMLTNKDTVPRIYYGDMYTDDGQYMATQTPYFDAIDTLLKARIKYVAGGQSMNIQSINDENNNDSINNSVLTSVRYGLGAADANSIGNVDTRTSGLAVIESNDPNLKLSDTDKIVVNMGAAHKNQSYRALISPTDTGLSTNLDDASDSQIINTDDNGNLVLDASDIKGYSNPQLSGYLSIWVPTGAAQNQDVRTNASNQKINDGQILNSNPALDSNVIYEGFSNFQSMPTTNDEYTNVVLAKNAQMFNNWGITYMELAPQYRSTTDNSFIDSIVQNGYAFNDRYDLGFNTPTKYGTAEQLADAIRSFHNNGIKVIADYVPDQLYSLPNKQVVSVDRTNGLGQQDGNSDIQNTLYAAYSKGNGNDYQAKYGGAFLDELQQKYPDLFTTKQISTGQTIDPSVKIKNWEAKYLNGTNLQGSGSGSVLSNSTNSDYFTVLNADNNGITKTFLPKQLSGENVTYGLTLVDGQERYISNSGYVAKNSFLKDDNGNWFYVDGDGNFVKSPITVNNNDYYFLSNGMNLRNFVLKSDDGNLSYYQNNGSKAIVPGYYTDANGNTRFVTSNGNLAVGLLKKGDDDQYYNDDGNQVKGLIVNVNGQDFYFDPNYGNLVKNGFFSQGNNWYYAGDDGKFLTGYQTIGGRNLYFDQNGVQVKDSFENINGKVVYFNNAQGDEVKNGFFSQGNNWYYAGNDGQALTGNQTIGNQQVYFNNDGSQVKGQFVVNSNGTLSYYDSNLGNLVTSPSTVAGKNYDFNSDGTLSYPNQFITLPYNDNKTYYLNDHSQITKGIVTINNHKYDFDSNGVMVVNNVFRDANGTVYMADGNGILSVLIDRNQGGSNAGSSSNSSTNSTSGGGGASSSKNNGSSVANSTHYSNASSASSHSANVSSNSQSNPNSATNSSSTSHSIISSSSSSKNNGSSVANSTHHSNSSSTSSHSADVSSNSQSNNNSATSSSSTSHSISGINASSKSNGSSVSNSTHNDSSASSHSANVSSNSQSDNNSATNSSSTNNNVANSQNNSSSDTSLSSFANSTDSSNNNAASSSFNKSNNISTPMISSVSSYTNGESNVSNSDGSSSLSSTVASSSSSSTTSNSLPSSNGNANKKHNGTHNKVKKYEIDMKNKQALLSKAKKKLLDRRSNKSLYNYHYSLKAYYKSEKKYLTISGKYSSKYYYDFDFNNVVNVKLKHSIYVYDGKQFNVSKRVKKLYKNDQIKIKKVVRNGKTTRLVIGHNKYITGLKSIIQKINQ